MARSKGSEQSLPHDREPRRPTTGTQRADAQSAGRSVDQLFMSLLSHELRTPLNAIIGFAEILAREPLAEGGDGAAHRRRDYAAGIRRSGFDLLDVLEAMLEIARLEANAAEDADDHPAALNVWIDQLNRELADRLPHGAELVATTRPDGRSWLLQPRAVRLAVLNLAAHGAELGHGDRGALISLRPAQRPRPRPLASERRLDLGSTSPDGHLHSPRVGAELRLALSVQLVQSVGGTLSVEPNGRHLRFAIAVPMIVARC